MDRKTAITLGLMKYDTGRRCCRGHRSPRYASSGACIECTRVYTAKITEAAREARAEFHAKIDAGLRGTKL